MIDTAEEKYFVSGEMSKETHEKLVSKFGREKEQIPEAFKNCASTSPNPDRTVEEAVTNPLKPATGWSSSTVKTKEKIQKLVFPEEYHLQCENRGSFEQNK